ncbi:hypothetical protein [Robertmurraya siralis]|uniref:hypothetical protein n=1 Tax=Robertmurraya siralis TaxID=77777 RepID=UPI0010F675CB|nr:hypothetical protein [Robertmurraya siralis]
MDIKNTQSDCLYCRSKNPKTLIACKAPYISAWVKIFVNEEDVRLGLSARGDSNAGNSVKINYCPICGRRFSNEQ